MTPAELRARSFEGYDAEARALATKHLALLQTMPLSLLPSYLVEIQMYSALFPPEQVRLSSQLDALERRPELMQPFAAITLGSSLERMDWVRDPAAFVGQLAAALWQSGQIDAYHRAGETLFAALPTALQPTGSAAPLLLAVFGQGAQPSAYPLFTRLLPHGMYLRRVQDAGALDALCAHLRQRAEAAPVAYAHWYVDGGATWTVPAGGAPVEQFSFPGLAPVTDAVLRAMDKAVQEGIGPEMLAARLRATPPSALGLDHVTEDPCKRAFFLSLLTEGSGTQLYSTSFVEAAAVGLLRRAQPQTLLARFAPRRKPASMNDMLEQRAQSTEMDANGALVDADMAAYYAWLALQRMPGGERGSLVAYVEGHGEAFIAGPAVTRGVVSTTPLSMQQVLSLL